MSIGNADAVQLAFTATAKGGPKGLSLALIGSAEKPTSAGSPVARSTRVRAAGPAIQTAAFSTALVQAVAAPTVITRAQWGAPAQACTPDVASTLVGAVVHHTADPNTYSTVAQAEQQIRNDAVYHINGLGWCDIGYNFVVDKWGNIYEGRANSRPRLSSAPTPVDSTPARSVSPCSARTTPLRRRRCSREWRGSSDGGSVPTGSTHEVR